MGKKKTLLASDKELTLEAKSFPDKKPIAKSFVWKEITEIKVLNCTEGFLFFKKPSEKIEIYTTHPERPEYLLPIEYYKSKEVEFFDEYIEVLKKYAEEKSKKFTDLRK